MIGLSFDATNILTRSFSKRKSKSVASLFTDLEGDDMRLTMGRRNKVSSNKENLVPLIAASALVTINYYYKLRKKMTLGARKTCCNGIMEDTLSSTGGMHNVNLA